MSFFFVGLVLLAIIVSVGLFVGVNYILSLSKSNIRERDFRREMIKLDSRETKALTAKDDFEVYVISGEREALRQRYVAGKDI